VTGEVIIRVAHGGKDRALEGFCREFGIRPAEVAAVGDSDGDISMFRAAGRSVAFNAADPVVAREASAEAPGNDLRALIQLLLNEGG